MNKKKRTKEVDRIFKQSKLLTEDDAVSSCTRQEALELFQSPRGRYIVGQALYIAHKALKKTEPSNSFDMRTLGKLFNIGWHIQSTQKLMRKAVANAK